MSGVPSPATQERFVVLCCPHALVNRLTTELFGGAIPATFQLCWADLSTAEALCAFCVIVGMQEFGFMG